MRANASRFELLTSAPNGSDRRLIAGGGKKVDPLPFPFSAPTWSGDGTRVAFVGLSGGDQKSRHLNIYLAAADGTQLEKVPGTREGFYPVLSPDGRFLAFAREATVFQGVSVWLLDLDMGTVRQLTPWRKNFFEYPSSFGPDGSTLAISRTLHRRNRPDLYFAVALRLDGSGSTFLARHAREPVYSPDGTKLALISIGRTRTRTIEDRDGKVTFTFTETDLGVANADGSGLTKLTHTGVLEAQPSWDPSGQRLAYIQLRADGREASFLGFGDSIMEINADGTCRTRILGYPRAALFGVTWQPGPGREAGPIAC